MLEQRALQLERLLDELQLEREKLRETLRAITSRINEAKKEKHELNRQVSVRNKLKNRKPIASITKKLNSLPYEEREKFLKGQME